MGAVLGWFAAAIDIAATVIGYGVMAVFTVLIGGLALASVAAAWHRKPRPEPPVIAEPTRPGLVVLDAEPGLADRLDAWIAAQPVEALDIVATQYGVFARVPVAAVPGGEAVRKVPVQLGWGIRA